MRIEAVALAHPARVVSNEEIVDLIREASAEAFEGDLDDALALVNRLLGRSGARTRHWLGQGECSAALIQQATLQALEESNVLPEQVDLLISASIDRSFIEPGDAYFMAKLLGARRAQCFDVLDACNGWLRALWIAEQALRAGTCKTVLVLNAEFSLWEGGPIRPALFRLERRESIAYSFPGYTLGEGVTATVLKAAPEQGWNFRFSSRPDLADLCTVKLPGYERHSSGMGRLGVRPPLEFTAFGTEMLQIAVPEMLSLLSTFDESLDGIDLAIPHAATLRTWEMHAEQAGLGNKMFFVYPRLGNLGSASIPAGLALARAEGRLDRGQTVLACVASAGMSFGAASFVF